MLSAGLVSLVFIGIVHVIGIECCSGAGIGPVARLQETDDAAIDEELKSKALRYHQALQRRPAPGFLFDRFVDAWLEFSTLSDLEQYLQQQVATNKKTNDQVLLALFYAKQGDDVKALAQFQTALADDPGSAATWFEKAAVAARTLDFETAMQDLAKAAELQAAASNPDKELGLNIAKQQASLLVRNSRTAEATEAWEKLLAANPADELLMEDIIEQQIGEGLYEQALSTTDRLLAITKDPYQLVMRRMRQGDILQRSGKQTEALSVYSETLPKVGRDTWLERELIAQIVELFRREDNFVGLKEQFEKLIADEPDRLALHKGLARTLAEIGQADEAITALEKVVELTPGDRANRENLISALATAGRMDAAVAQQEALIGQFPTDPELSIDLADYQKKRGQDEAARTALREYLKKANQSEAAYLRAARVSESFGSAEETRKLYQECLERFAESSVAREAYGTWMYQQGDKNTSLELWRQMANGADKTELLRIARQLAQKNEHATVVAILTGRLDSFDSDPNYLGQLIESSMALKQYSATIPWIRRRAMASRTSTEMESTIAQASIVFRRLEQPLVLLDALRSDTVDGTGAIRATGLGSACLLSELMELNGDPSGADQALAQFESAVTTSPDSTALLEVLGAQRIRLWSMRKDWSQAAEVARKLVESPGGRQSANLRRLVELYMRDGQPEQALIWIAQWKQSSPGSVTPWVSESQLLSRLNREDESLRVLRQAARRFPQDSDLAAMLAEKYTNAGQAREAERIYWRQYEQSQDSTDRLRWVEQLARTSMALGKVDELVALFRERQKSNPESVEPLLSLALVYREADNYEDRRAVLMEASRKQPENLQLLLETARLEESAGDWQDAIATLERALPLDTTGKVARQLAKISFNSGDSARAMQLLKNQMNDSNVGPRDVEVLVDSMLQADEWEVARELLLPQLSRWPDDWRLTYLHGVIELHLQANDTAREIFRRLLVVDNDIPGLSSLVGGSYYGGPSGALVNSMPTSLQVIQELHYRSDEPLAHEFREYYSGTGNAMVWLPDDAKVCRYYALWQLVYLSAESDSSEDERRAIAGVTGAGGFENADMYFDLLLGATPDGRSSNPSFSDELFERYGDRVDFCVLYALMGMQGANALDDEEKLLVAIGKFEESFPSAAFACLALYASQDLERASAEVKAKLEVLLKRLEDADVDMFLLESSRDLIRAGAAELPEDVREIRARLFELFSKWNDRKDGNADPQVQSELASYAIFSAIESQSATKIVELLERELDRTSPSSGSSSAPSTPYSIRYSQPYAYGNDEELIESLPFPPTQLLQVSTLFEVFESYMLDSPSSPDDASFADSDQGPPLLGQAIQQSSRPFLKAYLQTLEGRWREETNGTEPAVAYADAKASLESLLEQEPRDWNALVLAASLATHQERWDDTAALLERMAALPLSQYQRLTVDAAAVAAAVKGVTTELDKPEHAALVATARNAALRLRRHQLDQAKRYELMLALESLQLKEEAGQLESRLSQANSTNAGGVGSMPGFRAPVNSRPVDPIIKLLRENKKDAALRILTQQLNALAKPRLASFPSFDDSDYEESEFVDTVKQLDLGASLLEHVKATSSEKLDLLGFTHELFGDIAASRDYYQQYLDANPGRAAVRYRCLMLKLKQAPIDLVQHLSDIDSFDAKAMDEVGPLLLLQLGGSLPLTFEQRMLVLEAMVTKAEQQAKDKPEHAAWLDSAWSFLAAPTTMIAPILEADPVDPLLGKRPPESGIDQLFSGVNELANRIPHLYKPRSNGEMAVDELPTQELRDWQAKLIAAHQVRLVIHDRISKLLLTIPQTSESAFSHWLAVREAQASLESTTAVALAKSAVETSSKLRAGQGVNAMSGSYAQQRAIQQLQYGMRYGPDDSDSDSLGSEVVRLRAPIEFLAQQLSLERSAANDAQIAELAASLRGQRRGDQATELERRYALHIAPPEEFAAVVARMMQEDTKSRSADSSKTAWLCMEIYKERELKVDLRPVLLDLTRTAVQEKSWGNIEQFQPFFMRYLSHLSETDGPVVVSQTLADLAEIMCGDLEQQAALIAKYGDKPSLPPTRGDGAGYSAYVQMLDGLTHRPELGIVVMFQIARFKALRYTSVLNLVEEYAGFLTEERDVDKLLGYLELGFLNSMDEFDPILSDDEDWSTVIGTVYDELKGNTFNNERRLLRALKAREQTFGTRLFIAIVESTDSFAGRAEIHKAIKPDLDKLQAFSDERFVVFAAFIKRLCEYRSYYSSSTASEIGDPDVEVVLNRGNTPASQFEKIMAAKSLSDLGIDGSYYDLQELSERELTKLIEHGRPKEFVAALNHLLKLHKRTGAMQRQSDVQPFLTELVDETLQKEPVSGIAMMAWLVSEPSDVAIESISFYDDLMHYVSTTSLWEAIEGTDSEVSVAGLVAISNRLAELTQGADVSSLHHLFRNALFLNEVRGPQLRAVVEWANSAREDVVIGAIAQQWWIAGNMGLLDENADDTTVPVEEIREALVRQFRSESSLRSSRAVSAYTLQYRTLKTEKADLAACLDELASLIKEHPPTSMEPWLATLISNLDKIEDTGELKEVGFNFAVAIERHASTVFGSSSERSVEIPAIRLYHRLERPGGVLAVARGAGNVARTPTVLAELTRLGYANVAWAQLNRNWNSIDLAAVLSELNEPATDATNATRPFVPFDSEIEDRLPELIALANHPGTKYVTQLYISSLPDTADEGKRPKVARQARLADLAAKISEQTFNSADERKLALLLSCQTEELSESVVTTLEEVVGGLMPYDLWHGSYEDETLARNRQLLVRYSVIQLQKGNRASLDKLIEQLGKLDLEVYGTVDMVESTLDLLTSELTTRITQLSPETVVAITPDLLELGSNKVNVSQLRGLLQIWFMVHQRERELKELVNQASTTRSVRDSGMSIDIDELWPIALRLKPEVVSAAPEERMQFVKSVWQLTEVGASVGTAHFQEGVKESCSTCRVAKLGLDAIEDAKLLSADELMLIAPELARIDSVCGEIWRQIGHRQMTAEQWEAAESSMKRAVSDSLRSNAAGKANRQVELAWVLSKLGKTDEAKKVIGEMKSTELYGENPQRLTRLKAELQIE